MIFIYFYLIFRFPDFWWLIVFVLFIHYNYSNDLKDRIYKLSNLFAIIAVLIVIGTYYSDKRTSDNNITSALRLENLNNQIVFTGLKNMKDSNDQNIPSRKFQFLYTKQYWYKNVGRLSDDCLSNYISYLNNMENANRFVDILFDMKQYEAETNSLISNDKFNIVRQNLYKMNDWISVDKNNIKKQCYNSNSL